MKQLPPESVDAVVCDPPYGIGFMGKEWDGKAIEEAAKLDRRRRKDVGPASDSRPGREQPRSASAYGSAAHYAGPVSGGQAFQVWCEEWAREAYRVLKPGGHLLAFGGSRTFHRLTAGIEDAGFEIRDCLSWLYGSGFPKSLDVSKAIDKQRHDRDEVLEVANWLAPHVKRIGVKVVAEAMGVTPTMVSQHWCSHSQTAVPTLEQIDQLLAVLKVERNDVPERIATLIWELNGRKGQPGDAWFQREVTGQHDQAAPGQMWKKNNGQQADITAKERRDKPATDAAREWQGWGTALKPAWEPCVMARKPLAGTVAQTVVAHRTGALNIDACRIAGKMDGVWGTSNKTVDHAARSFNDSPSAEDYRSEKHELGRWPANVMLDEVAAEQLGKWSRFFYCAKASAKERAAGLDGKNVHPTVKPVALMEWLLKMVTPPGGTVLDPFAGSGSTGVAAMNVEAVGHIILIEREAEYMEIIRARVEHARSQAQQLTLD